MKRLRRTRILGGYLGFFGSLGLLFAGCKTGIALGSSSDLAATDVLSTTPDQSSTLDLGTASDFGLCPLPLTSGFPDAGPFCENGVDPSIPDGGYCYGIPHYYALPDRFVLWVDGPGGGLRITLDINQQVAIGGHTYMMGDGLTGSSFDMLPRIYGDALITIDGKPEQIKFHYEGPAIYRGNGIWDWQAALNRTSAFCSGCEPARIGRRYTITRTGATGNGLYKFVADEPPQSCGVGFDLLEIEIPGR